MSFMLNRKCCATCAFWTGIRETDVNGSHAKCEKLDVLGTCQNTKSPYKKKEKKADYAGCSKWEKWAALPKMK